VFFAHYFQGVGKAGAADDGGAVLVIVKDGDIEHAFEGFFNVEALGGFDVFEVDAAEGGADGGDDLDDLIGVVAVHFDVEYIDIGKFLEEDAFTFHYGFASQGASIP